MMPERPNGITDRRITSHRVAPMASAASTWPRGTCRKTSRDTAEMIGRIITARTTPVLNIVFWNDDPGAWKIGIQPK